MPPPTTEQLHIFYAQERRIFSKLVLQFSRSPAESLLVMATWLWLEDFFFGKIISTILAFTDPVIVALANEAVLCFQCLDSSDFPSDFNRIPLIEELTEKNISLQKIYKHRFSAITGVKNFLTTICSRIFSDILQRVLPSSSSYSFVPKLRYSLIIPGFPHPTSGSINVMPDVVVGDNHFQNNLFPFPYGLWGWNANCTATENGKTIFLTFSRGFGMSQEEVKDFFTKKYGDDCVEGVYMEDYYGISSNTNGNTNGQPQSLYARLVLDSVATVDRVLEGYSLKKFHNNGKPIWARKFKERRDAP